MLIAPQSLSAAVVDEPARLLDVEAVAKLLSCSTRTVYRLADANKMPKPRKLNSLCRWDARQIREWLDAGCPAVESGRAD